MDNYRATCTIDNCGIIFVNRLDFIKHQKDVHRVEYFVCEHPKCYKKEYTRTGIRKHFIRFHSPFDKRCSFSCGKVFKTKDTLYKHLRSIHCRETGRVHNDLTPAEDRGDFKMMELSGLEKILKEVGISEHFKLLKNSYSIQGFDAEERMCRWSLQCFLPSKPTEKFENKFEWTSDKRVKHLLDPVYDHFRSDKGHLSAAADNCHSLVGLEESYRLSNAVLMNTSVNCGVFNVGEKLGRDLAKEFGWPVIKVAGTIFKKKGTKGNMVAAKKEKVPGGFRAREPSSFFLIYLLRRPDLPPTYLAFLIPNTRQYEVIFKFKASLSEICDLAGITFFCNVATPLLAIWDSEILKNLHRCNICNVAFVSVELLSKHAEIHANDHKCSYCNKKFEDELELEQHKSNYHRKFSCSVCSKRFLKQAHLNDHLATHSGKRDFACGVCGKTFRRKSHVGPHMRVHTKEKRFTCDRCNMKFTSNYNCRRHMLKCKVGVNGDNKASSSRKAESPKQRRSRSRSPIQLVRRRDHIWNSEEDDDDDFKSPKPGPSRAAIQVKTGGGGDEEGKKGVVDGARKVELSEEEQLQLALAISQSEAEAKEQEMKAKQKGLVQGKLYKFLNLPQPQKAPEQIPKKRTSVKRSSCRSCATCLRPNCGKCRPCLNKKLRQRCVKRKCEKLA